MGAAVAVWCGLLAGAGIGAGAAIGALAAALPLGLIAWRGPDRVGTLALVLALALGGAARGGASRAALERERARVPAALVRLEGRVVEPPLREAPEPSAIVAAGRSSPPLLPGTRVRLLLPQGDPAEWGDRVAALARLERPPRSRNPGGFDARAAADAAGLAASGRALDATSEPARGLGAWPRATAARWRRAIESRLAAHLSPAARELVLPLVVGDRSALSPEQSARLRASGLVHLLALSGLHVAWLAGVARGACASLGGGPRARAVAGGLCALFYLGIAGPLPSLARAAASEIAAACARFLDVALDPVQSLALAALALLALSPGWAGDLGFQLSCAATVGLVTVGPWLAARCGRLRAALMPFVPTLSAQVTALPLLLLRFHAFSWVGAFANLAAVPVCGLLLSAAWLAALVEGALPGTSAPWFGACEALAALLRAIAERAAQVPGALVAAGPDAAVPLLSGIGAALLALSLPPPRDVEGARIAASRARVAGAGLGALAAALALALAATRPALAPPAGRWWCVALDVGQGDAVAIASGGRWWLVDAGPRSPRADAGELAVLPFLRWAAVRRLEALVLTHDDADHVGGAPAVLRGVSAFEVRAHEPLPAVPGPGRRFGAGATARGDTLARSPTIAALWPPHAREPAAATLLADNRAGVVLEVGEGRGRALLLADVDSTIEDSIAVGPGVALLKVAHHGSGSSSGARFLARLRPRCAVLSCGARNPFGHPDPGAVDRLRASGATLHRTDREGALWFELSPDGARSIDWRRAAPLAAAPAEDAAARRRAALARSEARW
ncbi:MAG TPA: DNA internalization-related competence protein ComEC/Rec2 [Candidatus Eisenbacteria bacterium]